MGIRMDFIKREEIERLIRERDYKQLSAEMKKLSINDCEWIAKKVLYDSPYGQGESGSKEWTVFDIQERDNFLGAII